MSSAPDVFVSLGGAYQEGTDHRVSLGGAVLVGVSGATTTQIDSEEVSMRDGDGYARYRLPTSRNFSDRIVLFGSIENDMEAAGQIVPLESIEYNPTTSPLFSQYGNYGRYYFLASSGEEIRPLFSISPSYSTVTSQPGVNDVTVTWNTDGEPAGSTDSHTEPLQRHLPNTPNLSLIHI